MNEDVRADIEKDVDGTPRGGYSLHKKGPYQQLVAEPQILSHNF